MTTKQDWLQQQKSTYPDLSKEQLVSFLNTPQNIPNPVPQVQVLAPISIDSISALIPAEERFNIQETKTYDHLLEAIEANNLIWLNRQIENLVASGKMSIETLAIIQSTLSTTTPDPNWQEYIPRSPAEQAGFDFVLLTDFT